ncbi:MULTISPECIES: glutaminase A [Solibacillus]|uniref:Glutaminase n=1 Tax=Solibacillus merdavium TaxID=2762218 RepID=A0ABR8XS88_9BACL|nr:glutaminase A [Solibacillus merdavium]MBD8034801.1 glutaminase A [Solibacillus merdavium]
MKKLQGIYEHAAQMTAKGKVATYIPALATANPDAFAVSLVSMEDKIDFGECTQLFTLQSVVKVFSFMVAMNHHGIEEILRYVDVEPTGDSFDSIVRLESHNNKPFNPMINAGAITVASLLPGETMYEKVKSVTLFLEQIIGKKVHIDNEVYLSEYHAADYNRAIAYILQANGFLKSNVEEALQVYLQLCSISVNVEDLAKMALYFATNGEKSTATCSKEVIHIAKALMFTCGMYNASGKFAAFIGLPAKSGVSGAIIAVVKNGAIEHLQGPIGIGIYGPAIDQVGNSVAGIAFLTQLSKEFDLFCL